RVAPSPVMIAGQTISRTEDRGVSIIARALGCKADARRAPGAWCACAYLRSIAKGLSLASVGVEKDGDGGNHEIDARMRRSCAATRRAGLVIVQALAFGAQIKAGFRPFGAPPRRVPFSWDMFAVRIERCDLRWDPPLPLGDGVTHLHDMAPAVEWDPVF